VKRFGPRPDEKCDKSKLVSLRAGPRREEGTGFKGSSSNGSSSSKGTCRCSERHIDRRMAGSSSIDVGERAAGGTNPVLLLGRALGEGMVGDVQAGWEAVRRRDDGMGEVRAQKSHIGRASGRVCGKKELANAPHAGEHFCKYYLRSGWLGCFQLA
jgi:hypothetical protein